MDTETIKKFRVYSKVQEILNNLANDGQIRPFMGQNVLQSKDEQKLFNDVAESRHAEVPYSTSRERNFMTNMTGFTYDPWKTAKNLRKPVISQGEYGNSDEPARLPAWYEGRF